MAYLGIRAYVERPKGLRRVGAQLPVNAPGLTVRQRWNRFWRNRRTAIPIVLDSNALSIMCYLDEMEDKFGPGWDGPDQPETAPENA